jgi:DNA-directed RNA polymerase subunit RPC12/RpoP
MKIINQPSTNWTWQYTCSGCDAELEVDKSDVKYKYYPGDYREKSSETYWVVCPVCNTQKTIPSLPKIVQLEIKKRNNTF